MTTITLEILVGFAALVAAIVSGYRSLNSGKRLKESLGDAVHVPDEKLHSAFGKLPLVTGSIIGFILVAIFAGRLAANDRFYQAGTAARIALASAGGVFIIAYGMLITTFLFVSRHYKLIAAEDKTKATDVFQKFEQRQWMRRFFLVLVASVLVVLAGTRFRVATLLPGHEVELGRWAPYLTVIYMVVATYAVVLLSGIHGAANVLLLVASSLVLFWTIGSSAEYFVAGVAAVIIGSSLGSLRFNLHPARLPMDVDGTAVAGFLFALLTVLSRQKTMAAMLLLVPLVLAVIVLGGMMLSGLERTIGMDSAEKK